MTHKSVFSITLMGLLLSIIPHPRAHADADFFKVLGIGAAVLTGACVAGWALSPSDEDMLHNASEVNEDAQIAHAWAINNNSFRSNPDEETLQHIALHYFTNNQPSVLSRLHAVDASISTLQNHTHRLQKRMYKIRSNANKKHLYKEIAQTVEQLESTIDQLCVIQKFMKKYKPFFELYQYECKMLDHYQQELHFVNIYHYDQYLLQEKLRATVIRRTPSDHVGHAYQQFINNLTRDINHFHEKINNVPRFYQNRLHDARHLSSQLSTIEQLIISCPDYARAIADYKFYLAEKKRLELEEERIRAEIRATEERNRIERERLRTEKERCKLEKERLNQEKRRLDQEREDRSYHAQPTHLHICIEK